VQKQFAQLIFRQKSLHKQFLFAQLKTIMHESNAITNNVQGDLHEHISRTLALIVQENFCLSKLYPRLSADILLTKNVKQTFTKSVKFV